MDQERLAAAVKSFHDAMEASPHPCAASGREGGWVDGVDEPIVEALLEAGWLAPSDGKRFRGLILDCLVREARELGLYEATAEPRQTR